MSWSLLRSKLHDFKEKLLKWVRIMGILCLYVHNITYSNGLSLEGLDLERDKDRCAYFYVFFSLTLLQCDFGQNTKIHKGLKNQWLFLMTDEIVYCM